MGNKIQVNFVKMGSFLKLNKQKKNVFLFCLSTHFLNLRVIYNVFPSWGNILGRIQAIFRIMYILWPAQNIHGILPPSKKKFYFLDIQLIFGEYFKFKMSKFDKGKLIYSFSNNV